MHRDRTQHQNAMSELDLSKRYAAAAKNEFNDAKVSMSRQDGFIGMLQERIDYQTSELTRLERNIELQKEQTEIARKATAAVNKVTEEIAADKQRLTSRWKAYLARIAQADASLHVCSHSTPNYIHNILHI